MTDKHHHEHEAVRTRKARTPHTDTPQANVPAPHLPPVVALQSQIGNRAAQRMVIQTKMTVTAANDAYEAEADTVAAQVVQSIQTNRVQREGEEDELMAKRETIQREGEEDELMAKRDTIQREGEEDELMAKRDTIQRVGDMSGSFEVGDEVESGIQSARGGGEALPDTVRGPMESAFGADFSGVRVHTDARSDSLNRSVGAKAFTQGSDIFFKSGAFQPGSEDGNRLLAHELTHTIQQGAVQQKREEK